MDKRRENFGSNAAAVMAMAGAAIGLGNMWRFPYMVGQNGGAAFILVYLACMLLLSVPIFLCEAIIGRKANANVFGAMGQLAPGTKWRWIGVITVVSPLIILSYYSVVGGWSIEYLGYSLVKGFGADISSLFGQFITSVWGPLICFSVFLLLTAVIVSAGVKKGIERFNKLSLPVLFVLVVIITCYSISFPGSGAGVKYLFVPDFSSLTAESFAAAMGQSFFSLSLGVGTVLVYASYMRKEDSILGTATGTAVFDLLFALIAGLAIMPAVFAAGIEPGAGPGLIFETLPFIFSDMGASSAVLSRIVSILFFLTVVVAALSSSISMYEVGVSYLTEEKHMSRRRAVVLLFIGVWVLGALCSLSFGPLSEVKISGNTIFNACDKLVSNYLMVFGSLLFVLFVGWKMKRSDVYDEFTNGGKLRTSVRLFGLTWLIIRYVAPVVILAIFVTNLIL